MPSSLSIMRTLSKVDDHDMDAIAEYTIQANANNTLSVKVTPTYQRGGIQQNMGYVISGSNQ